jgi:hypothetical protein
MNQRAAKFSKESIDYHNELIDDQDPQDLAYKFHSLMQMTLLMGDEYKEMYPKDLAKDPSTKMAFKLGITSFKSDSADFVVEHYPKLPITIVLFYDSDVYLTSIMRGLALKVLDVFVYKFRDQILHGSLQNFSLLNPNQLQVHLPEDQQCFDFTDNPGTTFESALPLILEDTLFDYVKHLHIQLNTMNLQVPWIYILNNRDLLSRKNRWQDPEYD